jgi:beta-phosphoglucomutase
MRERDVRPLRGVIFDLDGVLVSTDRFHFRAWKELAGELGLAFDEAVNQRLRGVSRQESLRLIFEHNRRPLPPAQEFEALCARKNRRYVELVGTMTPADVLPGAERLLDELRKAGVRTAVASASRNTPLVLERTGLGAHLDAVADGNDVRRSKPDPEAFLLAVRRLGLVPADCLGVEDAAAGIEAIHGAGMVAVGIGTAAAGAARSFPSVAELTAGALAEVFEDAARRRRT